MFDKPVGKLKVLMQNGKVTDAVLYCHQETTTIAGTEVYLAKKDVPADYTGVNFSRSTSSTGRYLFTYGGIAGAFYFQLTGVAKILAATIYATYRAYRSGSATVHCDIRISIIKNTGSLRQLIADGVSDSGNLTGSWATYTGANYNFNEYTVVDQTDWLVIAYYAHITVQVSGYYAYLRVDDNALALADQTRSQDWSFQAGVVLKEVTDTLGLSDALLRNRNPQVTDGVGLTDTPLKHWIPKVTDSVDIAEVVLRDKLTAVLDTIGLNDLLLRNKLLSVPESITLTEFIQVEISIPGILKFIIDSINLSDQIQTLKKTTIFLALSPDILVDLRTGKIMEMVTRFLVFDNLVFDLKSGKIVGITIRARVLFLGRT